MHWVAYHHGYTDPDFKMRVYNQLDRWSLPRADRVVTVCEWFRDLLIRNGVHRERTRVVSNAISARDDTGPEDASLLRASWKLPANARIILAVGRLSKEKGHRVLIDALKLLHSRYSDLHLVIVGDGPERRRCERQAEAAGIANRVLFTGHQKNTSGYYKLADLFVLPSLSEGSPNVLLEAMLARLPVVATAVGGVPEMVHDGRSALLVKAGDCLELAEAISRVLDQPELAARLRDNACQDVLEHHAPEVHYDALLRVYEDIVGRTSRIDTVLA
jgi:glycosyltransferase involved in cell wall biosynthesis